MYPHKKKRKKPAQKLVHKYILEIRDEDTFEKKISFRLSRLNVITIVGLISMVLVFLVVVLIAYTPLREYIPGYSDVNLSRNIVKASKLANSLIHDSKVQAAYIENLKGILEDRIWNDTGKMNSTTLNQEESSPERYQNIVNNRSKEDSLLREQIESEESYNLNYLRPIDKQRSIRQLAERILFFPPVKGILTDTFNMDEQHFGVDIVAPAHEAIKATLDGTVVFASWTPETGYVIEVQHKDNYLSVYKHNSELLKKAGNRVNAGDVIAIIGSSGELATGPHLHFELWYNGQAVNPEDYIVF